LRTVALRQLFLANSRLVKTKVLQAGNNEVDISHLTPGLYFLTISNRQGFLDAKKNLVQ